LRQLDQDRLAVAERLGGGACAGGFVVAEGARRHDPSARRERVGQRLQGVGIEGVGHASIRCNPRAAYGASASAPLTSSSTGLPRPSFSTRGSWVLASPTTT